MILRHGPLLVLLAAPALAVPALLLADDSRSAADACTGSGTTVAANSRAEVVRDGSGDYTAYGCYRRPRRLTRIGRFDVFDATGPRALRLSGRFVAWDYLRCSKTIDCEARVGVADLRTGKKRGTTLTAPGASGATDLEVTATGSAAWIRAVGESSTLEVRKFDSAGESLLDGGADIVPDSLAVSGSTVYWTRGDQPKSARLE